MTDYQKAILHALIDHDGRATNAQIYESAKKYARFGGLTPNNTIRRELQQCKYVRPADPARKGEWVLSFFDDEKKTEDMGRRIAELETELSTKDKQINYYESEDYRVVVISKALNRFLFMCQKKAQSVRKEIKTVFNDFSSQLDFSYHPDTRKALNSFDDENPPLFVRKEYHDNSTSSDINVAGMSREDIMELFENHNLLGDDIQKKIRVR